MQKSSWNTQAVLGTGLLCCTKRPQYLLSLGGAQYFLFFFEGGSVFLPDWLLTITLWGQRHFMNSYTVFICLLGFLLVSGLMPTLLRSALGCFLRKPPGGRGD